MKNFKKLTTILLSLVLTISSVSYIYADENDTSNSDIEKQETVYAFLDANGNFKSATVSEWLHSDNGFNNTKDESILSDIKNLKGDEEPTKNGNNLVWNSSSTDIYYQGTTTKELPLSMQVTYYFNGKKVNVEDVVGESGKLEIRIKLINNEEKTEVINGKTRHISTLFPCVIMTDLKTDIFEDVNAEGAIVVNESKNQVVSFVTVSGASKLLNDSSITELNDIKDKLKDEFVIKAYVTDFEMPSIYCAVSGMVDLDNDNITVSDLNELRSGINDLQDAMDQIVSGGNSLKDGLGTLVSNNNKLVSGSKDLKDGLADANTKLSALGLTQDKITGIKTSLGSLNSISYDNYNQAVTAAVRQQPGYEEYTFDADAINAQNASTIATLTTTVQGLQAQLQTEGITEEQKATIQAQIKTYSDLISLLTANSTAIAGTKTYLNTISTSIANSGLADITTTLDNLPELVSGISTASKGASDLYDGIVEYTNGVSKAYNGSSELEDGINKFNSEGVSKLSNKVNDALNTLDDVTDVVNEVLDQSVEYNNYAGADSNMVTSVKFIMKTEEVSKPEEVEETTTETTEETTTFWQRLVNLFKK